MRKRSLIITFVLCVSTVIGGGLYYYKYHHINNRTNLATLPGVNIIDLNSERYIELPLFTKERYALTATGISYNESDKAFYIGNYGKSSKDDKAFYPSIEKIDSNSLEIIDEYLIENIKEGVDIQGIAYDKSSNSLWYTNGNSVINYSIDQKKENSSFSIGKYKRYKANGICIDTQDASLWVLCMYKYLLHFNQDGSLIKTYNCDFIGQDHICMDKQGKLYISAGIDYQGNDNFVVSYNKNLTADKVYRVNESYAIEGIAIIDSKLYVVNDGYYHDAKIRSNYIQEYSIIE